MAFFLRFNFCNTVNIIAKSHGYNSFNKVVQSKHYPLLSKFRLTQSSIRNVKIVIHKNTNRLKVLKYAFSFPLVAHCAKPTYVKPVDIKGREPVKFQYKIFFSLLLDEIWYFLVAIISALAVAYLNIQIPICLGNLVNVISNHLAPDKETKSFLIEMKKPFYKLLTLYLSQSIFTFAYISALSISGEHIAKKLREMLFTSLLHQDIAFFDTHRVGELVNRLTTDIQEFKSSIKLVISQGLRSFAQITGSLVSIYLISPKMTLIVIVFLPGLITIGSFFGSILRKLSRYAQEQVSKGTIIAEEAIGNIRTVRAFAMEEKEKQLYKQEIEKAENLNSLLGVGIGVFQACTNFFLNGIVLAVIGAGGYFISSQDISPGNLMSFLVATQTVQKSLSQISLLFGHCIRGIASGARIFEYINLEPTIPLKGGKTIDSDNLKGNVIFKDVSFSYPSRPYQKILDNLDLILPSGKMVAICGLSGEGKSTIAALLERFYNVNSGSITIDGQDIKSLDPSWLRGKVIGYISQEPVLFATSIMENIRYGNPKATDEEVILSAKLANADDFICKFPHGYQTILGERGVTISGGQKQRIAIARALIKNPTILILDEATSALDAESEKIVQKALDNVVKGRTVLVIAHRLSTIQNADVIVVLSDGKVAEMGSHKYLLKKKALYWELIKHQQIEEELKEKSRH